VNSGKKKTGIKGDLDVFLTKSNKYPTRFKLPWKKQGAVAKGKGDWLSGT